MRKRFRVVLAVAVLTVVAAVMLALHYREPSYGGRTLSDWVVVMQRSSPTNAVVRTVVHRLGTNSLPLLMQWLHREDRRTLMDRLHSIMPDVENWLMNHRLISPRPYMFYYDPKYSYRSLATTALQEVGPDGRALIPELIQMLGDKQNNGGWIRPVDASSAILSKMAPDSIPPLIAALSSPDEQVRWLAAQTLSGIGPRAKAAIPVLEPWLQDKSLTKRVRVALIIEALGGEPRRFVPAIIEGLPGLDFDNVDDALVLLLRYKRDARAAVPALLGVYTNAPASNNPKDKIVRTHVMFAIKEIDPEAAPDAGVK